MRAFSSHAAAVRRAAPFALLLSLFTLFAVLPTLADTTVAAPTNLHLYTYPTPSSIEVNWTDNSTNENSFTVERKVDGDPDTAFTPIGSATPSNVNGTGDTLYFTDSTGLAADTQYDYRVKAIAADGTASAYSNTTSGITAPVAPINLTAAAVSGTDSKITLTFTDNARHTSYFSIYRSTDGVNFSDISNITLTPGKGNTETYTDTGLNVSTQYSYYVTAVNGAGNSPDSNTASATTNTTQTVPAAPNGVYGGANSKTTIRAYFYDNSTNETGFTLQRKSEDESGWTTINTSAGAYGTGTFYDYYDSGLAVDTAYSYRAYATNSLGNSPFSGIMTAATVPVAPINLTATATGDTKIQLTFTDNARHTSYFSIYRSTDGVNFSNFTNQTLTPGKGNTEIYTDTGLTTNMQYSYYVTAVNGAGESPHSNTATATTYPANAPNSPTDLNATATAHPTQVSLNWVDNSTDEYGFVVERVDNDDPNSVFTALPGTSGSSTLGPQSGSGERVYYNDTTVADDTSYSYRVNAINPAGASDYTNIAGAITVPLTPTDLRGVAEAGGITLTWTNAAKHAAGFQIFREGPGQTSFTSVATIAVVSGAAQTFTDGGLPAGQTYQYYVLAYNAGGKSDPTPTITVTSASTDTTPPTTSITGGPDNGATVCTSDVTFTVLGTDPDNAADTLVYAYKLDGGAYSAPSASTTISLTGLSNGSHTFTVAAIDPAGNRDPNPPSRTFTVNATPPVISAVSPGSPGQQTATITWTTDKAATSTVQYRVQGTTTWLVVNGAGSPTTAHSITINGLIPATTYEYQVSSSDGCNDATSVLSTLTTAADTTPPSTSILSGPAAGSTVCSTPIVFTVTGSDPFYAAGTLVYQYSVDGGAFSAPSSSTTITITGLADGAHAVVIRAVNPAGLADPNPPSRAFTVSTTPPVISAITSSALDVSATITWTTDKPATSQVDYGATSDYGTTTPLDNTLTKSHSVTITGLTPLTTYHYRVHSSDSCQSAVSPDQTLTTMALQLPTLSVTALKFPDTVTPHQTVTLSWTVLNTGPGGAKGPWNDSLYLSPTNTLNTADPSTFLLGTFSASSSLVAGTQYTLSPTIALPGMPPGGYYIIAVADSGDALNETTRAGNVLAVPITFEKVQTLLLTPDSNALTLHVGQSLPGHLQIANIGSTALTGLTVAVTGAPANVVIQTQMPDHVDAASSGALSLSVLANNASNLTGTATVTVSSADGESAAATLKFAVVPPKPNLVVASTVLANNTLTSGMVLGQQTVVQCTITNTGDATATGLQVGIPPLPWMALASPADIGDLPPGQSASVVLDLTPSAGLPLAVYRGLFAINGTNTAIPINFAFTAISSGIGDLKITTSDEFTYFADGKPPLTGATVTLTNAVTGLQVTLADNATDEMGTLLLKGLPAGPYQVKVTAPGHTDFNGTVLITAGRELDLPAFLSRELVTYQFTVVPISINDTYSVTLQAIFQTNVPAPVVTISPMQVDLSKLAYNDKGQATIYFTVTNHGLIAANDTTLTFPTRQDYTETTPVPDLGKLAALTTVVVPVTVTKAGAGGSTQSGGTAHSLLATARASSPRDSGGGGGGGSDCGFDGSLSFDYVCDGTVSKQIGISFATGACPDTGTPPPGGIHDPGIGVIGPTDGGSGHDPFLTISFDPWTIGYSTDIHEVDLCDPCEQAKLKAVVECLLGFLPTGCLTGLGVNGAECADSINSGGATATNAAGCLLGMGGAILNCVADAAGLGAAINLANCAISFPDCADGAGAGGGGASGGGSGPRLRGSHATARGFASSPSDLSTDPFVAQVQIAGQRFRTGVQPLVVLFGDPKWFSTQPSDNTLLVNFIRAFFADATAPDGSPQPISDSAASALAGLPLPAQLIEADVTALISRWNQTMANYSAGIFTASQLPSGGSTNFIDFDVYRLSLDAAKQAIADDQANGGDGDLGESLHNAELNLQQNILDQSQLGGTCAQVKIQLNQTVAMTRSAFQATLSLVNSAQNVPLTNVQAHLKITDAAGNDQTALFGITGPGLTGFSGAVDGTGGLAVGTTGTAQWTIVPTRDAAPSVPASYYVGGTISYQQNGTTITIPLYATGITVQPDPFLQLHYFLQGVVYGPDPFDPFNVNTPPEPFSLGLLAVNIGGGTAHDFSITSSQPTIVDNEKGLLVNFRIIGTLVDDQQVTPSLMIDFGDLTPTGTPGSTGAAQFLLTASLAGKFISYDASFKHTDDLGASTSLIDSVDIHSLEHVVRDLWPADDSKPDFLSEQMANPANLPDTLWSSDNTKYPVQALTNALGDTPVGGPIAFSNAISNVVLKTTLTVSAPSGFVYIRTDDPSGGQLPLQQVLRSDGTQLLIGPNVWTTSRNIHLKSGAEQIQRRLYIFDYNSTGTYTLIYGQAAPVNEAIGGLKQVGDGISVTVGQAPGGGSGSGSGGTGTGGTGTGLPMSGPVIITALFPDCLYVESLDRSSGIKVVLKSSTSGLSVNELVVASGILSTGANGERYIGQATATVTGTGHINPLGLTVKSLYGGSNLNGSGIGQIGVLGGAGLNPVGLFTSTLGKVTAVDSGGFFLDDGYGKPVQVALPSGVSAPTAGSFVGVNDVVSMENDPDGLHPLLRVRSGSDIDRDVSSLGATFAAPPGTFEAAQNWFSLPGIPADPNPNSVLSALTGGDLSLLIGSLFRYDAPTQQEVAWDASGIAGPFGQFLLGEGYRQNLNAAPAVMPSFAGYQATFADHWIPLPLLGATRIGDPFPYAMNWADVLVTDGTKTVSLADAARTEFPAWLSSSAQFFNNLTQATQILGLPDDSPAPDSTQLMPWAGYFVTSNRPNLALIVPVSVIPQLSGLTPSSAQATGPAFTLTVSGANFVNGATVDWNGAAQATAFISSTELTATITAADIATAGTVPVTVVNPNGQASNTLIFTVTAAPPPPPSNPVPTIATLNPASAQAGSLPLTLTVTGTNFAPGATVNWNGSARPTTVISATQATAQITAADLASAASVPVTIVNPAPGGGASNAVTFLVTAPSAVDVTGSVRVTLLSMPYNPITHTYAAKLELINISAAAISGPIELVFANLPAGITMLNPAGTFQGNPYLIVTTSSLAPNGSVTVIARFKKAGTAGLSYTPEVFSGGL